MLLKKLKMVLSKRVKLFKSKRQWFLFFFSSVLSYESFALFDGYFFFF